MVVFTGGQPKGLMPSVLASSDACLVHLKGCELFQTVIPSKIFEIMAMARPIIMGVKGQSRAFVLAAGAGLEMEPDCPRSLVDAVERLSSSRQAARNMGYRGVAYVSEHFDRNALAARFGSLLEDLAGVIPMPRPVPSYPQSAEQERKAA